MEMAPVQPVALHRGHQPIHHRHTAGGAPGGFIQRRVQRLQRCLALGCRHVTFVRQVVGMAGKPVDGQHRRAQLRGYEPRPHREVLGMVDPVPGPGGLSGGRAAGCRSVSIRGGARWIHGTAL